MIYENMYHIFKMRAVQNIQEEEDKRILQILSDTFKCQDNGNGTCTKCFSSVQEFCPIHGIEEVMNS